MLDIVQQKSVNHELIHGIFDEDFQQVSLALQRGADSNHKVDNDWVALHAASAKGLTNIAALLVAKGASLDLLDAQGSTPLRLAVHGGHTDIVN